MRLIILDDDEQICALLLRLALDIGFSAEAVKSAQKFQTLFRESRPDAVALDLQLQGSDGIEQLRFLSQQDFRGPIILMSGFDQRVLMAAEQIGASLGLTIATTVTKPARLARLREAFEAIWRKNEPITAERVGSAIANGETSIHLQPIIEASSLSVARFEALIRWHHPTRGPIPPNDFIPLAEQDGAVIDQLTMWVIEAAVRQYLNLTAMGTAVPIAVNVSAKNLHSLTFPDQVEDIVRGLDAPPSALTLEITESAATSDPKAMIDILVRLRLKGLSVSIDDFGTGYSSLIALHRLPFTGIKIDQSFVKGVAKSHEAQVIVKSIADLARNLGLQSVAEGVETEDLMTALLDLGVDLLQGYHFSRPLPRDAVADWVQEWEETRGDLAARMSGRFLSRISPSEL